MAFSIVNLRIVTRSTNQRNKSTPKSSTTGVAGVVPHHASPLKDGTRKEIWNAYVKTPEGSDKKFIWKRFPRTDQGLKNAEQWVKDKKVELYEKSYK